MVVASNANRLLVRPRPAAGEAAIGYLSRVAGANGFASLGCLRGSLKHLRKAPFEQAVALLGLTSEERASLVGPLPRAWGGDPAPLGLDVSNFNLRWFRWCPLCLRGGDVVPWAWTLKSTVVCSTHKTWLRDTCVACGRLPRWGPAGVGRCECGARLGGQVAKVAPVDVAELCAVASGGVAAWPAPTTLSAIDWQRAIVFFGQVAGNAPAAKPGKVAGMDRIACAAPLLAAAAKVLSNWPHGFHALLNEKLKSRPATASLQRTFDPIYRVLYRELASPPFSPFRDAFEAFLHEHWWGLVCERNRRLKPSTVNGHPRVPVVKAAAMAGVPRSVVQHMIQAQLAFADQATMPCGRRTRTMPIAEVDRVAALAGGALSLQRAAEALMLPERRVRDLIHAGEIDPLVSRRVVSSAAWLLPAAVVTKFTVGADAIPGASSTTVRDFMRYGRLSPQEAVALIRNVARGLLVGPSGEPCRKPIGSALVDRCAAWGWLRQQRSTDRRHMSVDQAARELGIKQEVGYALVRAGLLGSSVDARGKRHVRPADVARFRAEYVSLRDLARQVGASPRAALCGIRAQPVAGPGVDANRQYFFRRADVEPTGGSQRFRRWDASGVRG